MPTPSDPEKCYEHHPNITYIPFSLGGGGDAVLIRMPTSSDSTCSSISARGSCSLAKSNACTSREFKTPTINYFAQWCSKRVILQATTKWYLLCAPRTLRVLPKATACPSRDECGQATKLYNGNTLGHLSIAQQR